MAQMRKLVAKDIFSMCSIINKIGIDKFRQTFNKPEVKNAISGKTKVSENELGMTVILDVLDILIGSIPKCEQDLYVFLSSLSGIPEKDMPNLDFNEFFDLLEQLVKKEEFKDFFSRALKLLK